MFDEKAGVYEKKEIESRVYFTLGEADVLRAYASLNGWSLSKEIRYRTVSSFAKKPKLSGEELKSIYSVRSSINILGANFNRLVRDQASLSDDNIAVCQGLALLMKELRDKISYLEKCSTSRFKLKILEARMGVKVEDEWRLKRVRSERASKSAFAYKINSRLKSKTQVKMSYGYGGIVPYSREVILKITGGARSKKGIKNAVNYISKDWQAEIVDSNGISYKTKKKLTMP